MIKHILLLAVVTISLCVEGYSQCAYLDKDSVYNTTVNLKEVTVHSSKELHKLKSLPASVSLISEDKIQKNNILSLKDLSSFIPNLFMPDYGSKLTSPIYIRGIGSKIGSPSVGLYVDGVPYFEKACFDFEFADIASIEILRGPQGTLYGRNTMGGIINIHTLSPEDTRKKTISAEYGEYGYRRLGASVYEKIAPKWYLSLNANYNAKDGFFKNTGTGESADDSEGYNGTGKLIYRPNDKFKSALTIGFQNSEQTGYPYGKYHKDSGKIDPVNYNRESSYDRDMLSVSLYNEYKQNGLVLSASTSYNYYKDHQAIDQDFTIDDLFFVNHYQKQNMVSQEIMLKSENKDNYRWVFGVFGFYQSMNSDVYAEIFIPRAPSYSKHNDVETRGGAIFHQSTYKTGDFSFSLGARLDYEKAELDYLHLIPKMKYRNGLERYIESFEFLPKASFRYMYGENNFLYGSLAKGYKTGGFNSSFEWDKQDKEYQNVSYDPEYSWNYEIGSKNTLWDNRLTFNVTAFYIDWTNQQIAVSVPSGQGRVQVNAGESESKGIEIETAARIKENLSLQMTYGYTDAKFNKYTDVITIPAGPKKGEKAEVSYKGNKIPYIPKQTFSVGLNHKMKSSLEILDYVDININYKGIGEHYWDTANKVKQSYYSTIDTKVSFVKRNFSLSIFGKNITDADYIAYHFSSMGNDFAQNGKPAYWGVGIKYTY